MCIKLKARFAVSFLITCVAAHGFAAPVIAQQELPLLSISDIKYKGGFRLPAERFGSSDNATHSYSPGPIAFNSANQSLFTVSHDFEQGIGEFAIPELVASQNPQEFNTATLLQAFRNFHEDGQAPTGIDDFFRVTGMALVDNKLLVNYFSWYDAAGDETDTTVVFQTPSDLENSAIVGPFQLEGAAHASGWITPVPKEWESQLGGNYVVGHAHGSINSRLSTGPSAHALDIKNLTQTNNPGAVPTKAVLDFSLDTPLVLTAEYDPNNLNGDNDLWTNITGASFGIIVPDSDTYLTLGYSGGHQSGIGYKIVQSDGNLCGGFCSADADDNYNYYWLWRVSDLVKVKNGAMAPHQVSPYEYGIFNTVGNTARIMGASYDASKKQLYVSLANGDTIDTYARPPLILAYSIKVATTGAAWMTPMLNLMLDE